MAFQRDERGKELQWFEPVAVCHPLNESKVIFKQSNNDTRLVHLQTGEEVIIHSNLLRRPGAEIVYSIDQNYAGVFLVVDPQDKVETFNLRGEKLCQFQLAQPGRYSDGYASLSETCAFVTIHGVALLIIAQGNKVACYDARRGGLVSMIDTKLDIISSLSFDEVSHELVIGFRSGSIQVYNC